MKIFFLVILCFSSIHAIKTFSDSEEILSPLQKFNGINKNRSDNFNDVQNGEKSVQPKYLDLYLPSVDGSLSPECRRDVIKLMSSLSLRDGADMQSYLPSELWPLKMVDSWGKQEDGILLANLNFAGMKDECFDVVVDDEESAFVGEYCSISYQFDDIPQERLVPIPSIPAGLIGLNAICKYSTCMPSTCTKEEIEISANRVLKAVGGKIDTLYCGIKDEKPEYDASTIVGIVLFSIFGSILLLATVLDYYFDFRNTSNNGILSAFSIRRNLPKMLRAQDESPPNVITCVHGLRTFSLLAVVTGHQLSININTGQNFLDLIPLSKPVLAQTIINADKSVDTFFCLSGIFLSFGVFNELKKTNKFNFAYYYIHRFVRLLPPIALVILYVATISHLFVSVPMREQYLDSLKENCRQIFWTDLIFADNLMYKIFVDTGNPYFAKQLCIPQGWYLGVDMQLFLIMPLFILPLFYRPKFGKVYISVVLAVAMIIPGALVWDNDLRGSGTQLSTNLELDYSVIYPLPYCRAQSYLVGVIFGYILHKTKDKKVQLSSMQVSIGWCLAGLSGVMVIYGIYPYNHFYYDMNPAVMPLMSSVIFQTFQRATWSMVIGWIVIACHWGYGGILNSLLSYPAFQPLSRLSYMMYLVSISVQEVIITSAAVPAYTSWYTLLEQTCGSMIIIFMLAIILSLISESPILNIEKMILRPNRQRNN